MKGEAFDLRRLRYFAAVAAAGSQSAAARSLNVAQSALSHQIGELERSLGKPAFLRTPRGLELTDVGRVLLAHTQILLGQVAAAETALNTLEIAARSPATLRLSLTPSIYDIASELLSLFIEEFPTTRLTITEDRHRYCRDLIERGQRDLAMTLTDQDWPGGHAISWEEMHLVRLPETAQPRETVRFCELAEEERLIVPGTGGPLRDMVEDIARKAGVSLSIAQELQGSAARKNAVLNGLGTAIIPWRNVAEDVRAGKLAASRIVEPFLRRELVMRSGKGVHPDVANRFASILRKTLNRAR